jgi:hypothetical protein
MTLLTYWGRCTACRARLRVFDHRHGNAKTRAGFISKVTQRDDEIAFEDPDGSFACPRCDAQGRIVGQKVICPTGEDAAASDPRAA